MITVVETWRLRPEYQRDAMRIMQEMDDLVGPNAHENTGWCGHARFFQSESEPAVVLMIYPWQSRESHASLVAQEEPLLRGFFEKHCAGPREISYYSELAVDVEAHHDAR
jgi:hypothetical protein